MALILPSVTETVDAAAGTSTAYSLGIGQTAQGTIASLGDHDWYRITLVAGQTYSFALVGTGTNSLQDPFLSLRNSAGTILVSNDDGGPGSNSSITFTATASGTYYLDAGAWNDGGKGQYGIAASVGTKPNFDIPMGAGAIDALASWTPRGTGAVITYGFRQSPASYTASGHNISTFSQCSPAEMAAVQQTLQLWGDVCNVTFQQVNPGGYTDNATILIGNYADPNDGAGAFAFYPGSAASAGDLWLNLSGGISTVADPVGSYSFFAIMHELGHALGLSHPGDYNAAPGQQITYANNAQFVQDSEQYSVMSYFGGSATGETPGGFASGYTPMMFDIYELQQLYGVNTTTRTDNTTYGFGSTAGSIYSFSAGSVPQYCIWDAGGTDTLNCSGYSQAQLINLNQGTFSNIGGGTANISIALGATIENAVGGSGNDTIFGNDAANMLTGGGGNDTIDGGLGFDTAIFSGTKSGYTITHAGATTTVSGASGIDTLTSIEMLQFADGSVSNSISFPAATKNDFNGDLHSEILLQAGANDPQAGTPQIWVLNGASVTSQTMLPNPGAAWTILGTGDFDNNTEADLLLEDSSGNLAMWEMNGTSVQLSASLGNVGTNWKVVDIGDFNADAHADLLWEDSSGNLAIWEMNGPSVQMVDSLGNVGTNWKVVGVGDFNADGKADLLWQTGSGDLAMWEMNGATVQHVTALGNLAGWQVRDIGDFDGDGKADILWQSTSGDLAIWEMNGPVVKATGGLGNLGASWKAIGTGDYNADGDADILFQNTDGTPVIWTMNGTTHTATTVLANPGQNWHAVTG